MPPAFAELDDFAKFWVDEGRLTPCCQTASDEEVDDDATVYQCERCPVFERINQLDTDNYRAWHQFHKVCTRFTIDQRMVGTVLARTSMALADEDFEDLVTRLSILYDVYYPQKREGSRGA